MSDLFSAIGKILFILVLGFLFSLLKTYIILDIANLFQLGFVTELGFAKVYGLIMLFALFSYKINSESTDSDEYFSKVIGSVFTFLVTWGVAYLIYPIIT